MGARGNDRLRRRWTVAKIRRAIEPLAADRSVALIVLFGSMTGARPDRAADIDLAIRCDRPQDPVELSCRVIRLLHEDSVDVVDLVRAAPLLAARVAEQGVLLYEREPGGFMEFRSLAWRRWVDTRKLREPRRRRA